MKNTDGVVRILISAVICSAVALADFFNLAGTGTDAYAIKKLDGEITEIISSVSSTEKSTDIGSNNSKPAESEKTVEASSDSVVKGKIINKFSSPYTANTSYGDVFLKNKTSSAIDIKALLDEDLSYKISKNGEPQVLILHSHATESFMNEDRDYYTSADSSRSVDTDKNTVALGKIVAQKLNAAGINTVQSETLHDYPDYNRSYQRSAETVKEYLKKYPSIKVVLDLHRDAVGGEDKVKLTTQINGKSAAQVMLVMSNGFEGSRENLKLAVRLQQTFEVLYPTLARSISLVGNKYNQNLTSGSMLLEIGTDANSMEEVKYSAELVGNSLVSLLNTIS